MNLISYTKSVIDALLNPADGTRKRMNARDSILMYYRASIIPGILYVILAGAYGFVEFGSSVGLPVVAPVMAIAAVMMWVAFPVAIVVLSAVYHVFAKLLGMSGGFGQTLTATVYSALPAVFVIWLSAIPYLGSILLLVVIAWGAWVFSNALANQHGSTRLRAFAAWIIPTAIIGYIALSVLFALAAVLGTAGAAGLGATTTI
jgi:hypothetical protein